MQLTIELPEDIARSLTGIANAQQKTVEQVAVERLRSTVNGPGSPSAVLSAMKALPRVNSTVVDELDAAIAAGRLPVQDTTLFER